MYCSSSEKFDLKFQKENWITAVIKKDRCMDINHVSVLEVYISITSRKTRTLELHLYICFSEFPKIILHMSRENCTTGHNSFLIYPPVHCSKSYNLHIFYFMYQFGIMRSL
jgi:hypothetical protein